MVLLCPVTATGHSRWLLLVLLDTGNSLELEFPSVPLVSWMCGVMQQ